MSLNGTTVLDATDNEPLVNGAPGLQAYTYPIHDRLDVRWHDFAITAPAVNTDVVTSSAPPNGGSVQAT